MLRFLLRPRWVGLTVFAVAVVALCARLGIWQLDRLDGRRAFNARYEAGLRTPPVPLDELLARGDGLAYRRAIATGRFDTSNEVILYGRSLDGRPGNHLLTPLILTDGRAVLVDRGWVPFELDDPPVESAAPPAGEVEVHGPLFADRGDGPVPPADERPTTVSTVDLGAIGRGLPYELLRPWYLQLSDQLPAGGDLPVPAPPPELTDGPHLSYAFQWFTFAAIAAIGYVVLVYREVADARREDERSGVGATGP